MAVFDSTTLLYVLDPEVAVPIDPQTRQPVAHAKDRVNALIERFQQTQEVVVVPTPVLSEVLVNAGSAAEEYVATLGDNSRFRIVPFGERAAIELSIMLKQAFEKGGWRKGTKVTRAEMKFDRQILAIARVEDENHIYTDDGPMTKFAEAEGFKVTATRNIPLPSQAVLPLAQDDSGVEHSED